jgi:hypothetical protein
LICELEIKRNKTKNDKYKARWNLLSCIIAIPAKAGKVAQIAKIADIRIKRSGEKER